MVRPEQIIKELKEYEAAIGQTKQDIARDQGVLQGMCKQLKEVTGTDDLEASRKIVDDWKNEKEKIEKELGSGFEDMKARFPL